MARFYGWVLRHEGRFDEAGWAAFLDSWSVGRRMLSESPSAGDSPAAAAFGLALAPADEPAAAAAPRDGDAPVASATSLTGPVANAATVTAPVAILTFPPSPIVGGTEPVTGAFAMMSAPSLPGHGVGAPALSAASDDYLVLFGEGLDPALVVDMDKREILTEGFENPQLGAGRDDVLVLAGDLDDGLGTGVELPLALRGLESIVVRPGADYNVTSPNHQVAAGATLAVNAAALGTDDSIRFDGSAESDGRFDFLGGDGGDTFLGGAGDDRINGRGGGDNLRGGEGADVFGYGGAADSSGAGYDTLLDFDPGEDRINLQVAVTGFGAAIEGGSLSAATFDDDLAAVLGADGLGSGKAVLFTPDAGDLAGTLFLIVDANGEAGYQAGEDFVFALPNADPADLSNTGIFV